MKRSYCRAAILFPLIGASFVILDSRCAVESMRNGLELCLKTMIPSLFPLIVLSGLLVPQLAEIPFPPKWGKFLGLPNGAESLFLLGCIGGFPVGAQCITQAVKNKQLPKQDGERMLGFCCNCGAAFLFGILPTLFEDSSIPLLCFLIQLESAILVAVIWAEKSSSSKIFTTARASLPDAIQNSIRAMATICSWILLSCVATGFLQKWFFPFISSNLQILCTGLLELTAGCLSLPRIPSERFRFIACCGMLCFGGISVLLQIHGITAQQQISMKQCILQKLLQAFLGICIASFVVRWGYLSLFFPIPICCFFKKEWNYLRSCGIISSKREVSDHAVS